IRDVHIYRFISQHTVEEALLRKANQKRSLDDLVIQKGEFDWRTLFVDANETALTRALGEFEDAEDAQAAQVAAREAMQLESEDARDFEAEGGGAEATRKRTPVERTPSEVAVPGAATEPVDHARKRERSEAEAEIPDTEDAAAVEGEGEEHAGEGEEEEEGRTTVDYMLDFVREDWEYFSGWNV
ncbi:hypothetical protein BV20DRAFT_976113, partial [Pilatotrama ljubarskyi]